MSRPESFLLRMRRATVAAAGCMGSCEETSRLAGNRFGQCHAGERQCLLPDDVTTPVTLRPACNCAPCLLYLFLQAHCQGIVLLAGDPAGRLRGVHADVELEWHVPEHTEIIILAAKV